MTAENPNEVVISRKGSDLGVNDHLRVYVTGPHFDTPLEGGIYSSTLDAAEASRFDRATAERLVAMRKWRPHDPLIEESLPRESPG